MEDKITPPADLTSSLSVEKTRHSPNIEYEIYFSPHGNPNDFQELFKIIKSADIYIPEVHGWTKSHLEIYQDVSSGKKTPEVAIREKTAEEDELDPLLLDELNALYGTNIPVIFIDLPEDEMQQKTFIALSARDFDGLLDSVRYFLQESSKLIPKREEHMVKHLKTGVEEILESRPDLKAKNDISVLISLGGIHRDVFYRLKEAGEKVQRKFNIMPQVYSLSDEGKLKYMHGKPVDDELAARILLETVFVNVFQSELEKVSPDNTKIDIFKRRVVSQFTLDEIRGMLHSLTYLDWNYFKSSFEGGMVYQMEMKGLKLPQSEKELDEMIKVS